MPVTKKRLSSITESVDAKELLENALKFELSPNIYPSGQLDIYLKAKAKKLGVLPTMLLPSLLSSISSVMNMAEFKLTESWVVNANVFMLCVANKGAGKTPAGRVFLDPLLELEQEDKMNREKGKKENDTEEEEDDGDGEQVQEKNSKRCRYSAELAENGDDYEKQLFRTGQRIVDSITPEALFLILYYGSGSLMIKADEFKGLYDKFIIGAQNISALCSAFSGEPINYTTVKRGALTIYESRLSIFGSIQPSLLVEIINGPGGTNVDHQGLFDRFILIASSEDKEVDFEDQLKEMEEESKFDVFGFLKHINDVHVIKRTYRCTDAGLDEIKRIKKELKKIDELSSFGNETAGMTAKSFTNMLKLAPIYACARQAILKLTEDDPDPDSVDFMVTGEDVKAAWPVVQYSIHSYTLFKISIGDEMKKEKEVPEDPLHQDAPSSEEVISVSLTKIIRLYEKAQDNKILISVVKRDGLYPKGKGFGLDVFLKALEENGIGSVTKVKSKIGHKAMMVDMLTLTTETESPEIVRVFELLFERAKLIPNVFDPLKKFELVNVDPNENK